MAAASRDSTFAISRSSGTAVTIVPDNHFIKLDTASSQTGAIFSAAMPLGVPFVIFNPDSDSGVLYPMSGATINGASSLTVAQNKTVISRSSPPSSSLSGLSAIWRTSAGER